MAICVTSGSIVVNDGAHGSRVIRPADGSVRLSKKLEARFVQLGAARYVDANGKVDDGNSADETPDAPSAGNAPKLLSDDDPVDDKNDAIYSGMTVDELRAECDERGITYHKRAGKNTLIGLLEADDEPPAIEAHGIDS